MSLHSKIIVVIIGGVLICSTLVGDDTLLEKQRNAAVGPLSIHIRSDKYEVRPMEKAFITVELHNDSFKDQVVYMPGISGGVICKKHGNGPRRPDELGPPLGFGRFRSSNIDEDFVVLKPGDLYGRRYSFAQRVPCDMHFMFYYENKNDRKNAWTGKSSSVEAMVKVRSAAKEEQKDKKTAIGKKREGGKEKE